MSWILTYTGRRFDLLEPTAAMVSPQDLAHALARLCRFNGHCVTHYSVAQHSCFVADLVPAGDQLAALLHDATEAYVGDMVRPLKDLLPEYREIEHRIWLAICERFLLDPILPASVKRADLVALATERRDLMPNQQGEWNCLIGIPTYAAQVMPRKAEEASFHYFRRLMDLMQTAHRGRAA